ncbi:MAG: GAF domain-containing protein, partial [Chloroflexota bacterium]
MPKSKSESSPARAKSQRAQRKRSTKARSAPTRQATPRAKKQSSAAARDAQTQNAPDWEQIAKQSAAELQIINSVQQGLAAKLDMQGIYDLVGDKIREIFKDVAGVLVLTYDRQAQIAQVRYGMKGVRTFDLSKIKDKRFFEYFEETRQTLLVNQNLTEASATYGIYKLDEYAFESATTIVAEGSALFVPLLVGSEVKGLFSLQDSNRENAFSESDVRLLQTLASSMSVALENARLFDETQRLLKESEQRAAELQIINSVQQGLASKLDMQGIFDLVGDKIQHIFNAQVVTINMLDRQANLAHCHYMIEKGQRIYPAPMPPVQGIKRYLEETHQPLLINQNLQAKRDEWGIKTIPGTDPAKSFLAVPLIMDGEIKGTITLQDIDREYAFSESDVRLLETLANSMGVALENARLFDETQRLLKESEQRAAELAIINSVQQGLASKIDFQSILGLVGDQVRATMKVTVTFIAFYDKATGIASWPYFWGANNEPIYVPDEPLPDTITKRVLFASEPLNLGTTAEILAHGAVPPAGYDVGTSFLGVPFQVGDSLLGALVIAHATLEHAFSDSDARLLQTLASSMSVALENARLFDETQRLLKESEQRAAELLIINSVQQGLASKLDMQGIYDLVGDKIREIFDAQTVVIYTYDP